MREWFLGVQESSLAHRGQDVGHPLGEEAQYDFQEVRLASGAGPFDYYRDWPVEPPGNECEVEYLGVPRFTGYAASAEIRAEFVENVGAGREVPTRSPSR